MAVRFGQISSTQVINAADSVPVNLDSEVMACSSFSVGRYLIVGILISDNGGSPVTINSVKFNPGVSEQSLTLIQDCVSAGKMFYFSLENPAAVDAVVRVNATSSGNTWNAVMETVLLYDVGSPAEDLLTEYSASDVSDFIQSEISGKENQMHLTFLGIDSTTKGSQVDKPLNNDGSTLVAYNFLDETEVAGGIILTMFVTWMNGDKYADRITSKYWIGDRTTYYAFNVRIKDHTHLNVNIPGAITEPGHVANI